MIDGHCGARAGGTAAWLGRSRSPILRTWLLGAVHDSLSVAEQVCLVTGVIAWYVRHGHNLANQHPRQLSHRVVDHPLTDLGIAQAAELGRQLGRLPAPLAIYVSPLRRAVQTAEIIVGCAGGEATIIEELRELNVGELDGRRDAEAWGIHDRVLADWRAGRRDSAFPGGEDYYEATARFIAGLANVLRHPEGSPVLVVGHGGILRAGILAICPDAPRPTVDLHNCEIAELELRSAPGGATGALKHWPLTLDESQG
jgi:broad specificity phosphatase PhoE